MLLSLPPPLTSPEGRKSDSRSLGNRWVGLVWRVWEKWRWRWCHVPGCFKCREVIEPCWGFCHPATKCARWFPALARLSCPGWLVLSKAAEELGLEWFLQPGHCQWAHPPETRPIFSRGAREVVACPQHLPSPTPRLNSQSSRSGHYHAPHFWAPWIGAIPGPESQGLFSAFGLDSPVLITACCWIAFPIALAIDAMWVNSYRKGTFRLLT